MPLAGAHAQKKKQPAPPPDPTAAASPWASQREIQLRLVAAESAVAKGTDALAFGLHVRLEPGWKFYWRTPGDAGVTPDFDWSNSRNVGGIEVRWPTPERTVEAGLTSFVYHDEVVLPINVTLENKGQSADLRLRLSYGVCREICIPYEHDLALALRPGKSAPTPYADLLARYAARVPADASTAGVEIEQISVVGSALEIRLSAPSAFRPGMDLLIEGPEGVSFGAAQPVLLADGLEARWRLPVLPARGAVDLPGAPITLTLIDGPAALEAHGFVAEK